jgi:hypothetical protein
MSRRFDDPSYVQEWLDTGTYPRIHDAIFYVAAQYLTGAPALDLCCSTGLLGKRVMDQLGIQCFGVDGDFNALLVGQKSGVFRDSSLMFIDIKPDTLKYLGVFLSEHRVSEVLARRCLYELAKKVPLSDVANLFYECGVTQIIMEGHVFAQGSTNFMLQADNQALSLLPWYEQVFQKNNVRVLRRSEGLDDHQPLQRIPTVL